MGRSRRSSRDRSSHAPFRTVRTSSTQPSFLPAYPPLLPSHSPCSRLLAAMSRIHSSFQSAPLIDFPERLTVPSAQHNWCHDPIPSSERREIWPVSELRGLTHGHCCADSSRFVSGGVRPPFYPLFVSLSVFWCASKPLAYPRIITEAATSFGRSRASALFLVHCMLPAVKVFTLYGSDHRL